jgi:mannose-6-phosphate isomerase-like protein (cupin superfamily)
MTTSRRSRFRTPRGAIVPDMSYPDPRYLGDGGEVSASYHPADAPPDLRYESGTTVDYLATGSSTHGLFGLYRWDMAAGPGGPDPHFHRTMSESFFILAGSIRIFDGREWIDARPGDFIHVPEGGIHGFKNASGEPASMLIHFAPGAPREAYFEGTPRLAGMTEEERTAFMRLHDQYMSDPR